MRDALQKLIDRGHVAYVVGGSVRDFLLGRKESKDHDIATDATVEEIEAIFVNGLEVGKKFGVIKVPVGPGLAMLEIATFRQDLTYKDHRRPEGVKPGSVREDAKRRDFTVNGLYYDAQAGKILDQVDGTADLKARVVRAIGDPRVRFQEDALRLLRAVRFTTQLGFKLDPATFEAAKNRARLLGKISAERIRDELTAIFTGPAPAEALRLLVELDLLVHALPALERLRRDRSAWQRTLKTLEALTQQEPQRSATLAWSAALSEVGREGEDPGEVANKLRLSGDEASRIRANIEDFQKFKEVFQMREATLQRFIRQEHFPEALALHRANASVVDGNLANYEFAKSRYEEAKSQPESAGKLIKGEDLIELGFRPSPRFAEILRTVEDLALERKLLTKEEALEYVLQHFVG